MSHSQSLEAKGSNVISAALSVTKESSPSPAREPDMYRALVDRLPVGVCCKDLKGRFVFANKLFCEMVDRPLDDILGKTDFDLSPSPWTEKIARDEQRVIESGEPFQDVEWRPKAQDDFRYFQAVKTPVSDPSGKVLGIQGVFWDITDRINAEEALRTSEERFRQLSENINEVFWILDPALKHVFYVSPAYEKLRDRPCSTLYETPALWLEDIHPEDRSRFKAAVEQQHDWELEYRIVRPDGTVRWLSARAFPLTFESGDVYRVVGISQDISERKRLQGEHDILEVQLRQSQKLEAIGQLAAGIAHEINTPTQYVGDNTRFVKEAFETLLPILQNQEQLLAAAKTGAIPPELIAEVGSALQKADLPYLIEQVPAAIQETLEGVNRVTQIVRAMKEFSHPGSADKTAVDIHASIESTITVARNEWRYVAEIETDFDDTLPSIPCFVGEFNQVILNLLVNAAHAIADVVKEKPGSKGLITIQTRRDGEWAEIRVRDTGTGIPEAVRPRIFEPFFTTKAVGKGTGQGLAIAYAQIVKKHNGTIHFETELGKGTSFVVRLPLASRSEASAGATLKEAA